MFNKKKYIFTVEYTGAPSIIEINHSSWTYLQSFLQRNFVDQYYFVL